MIIVLKPGISDEELQHVIDVIEGMGLTTNVSRGMHRTVVGVIGEEDKLRVTPLESIPGVEKVMPVLAPYKLASREFKPASTQIEVGTATVGAGSFAVVAGPCVVETREILFEVARTVKEVGGNMLRGGAFKPRTSPYSFRGLGEEGLKYLRECGDEIGLPVVTEVMDTRNVPLVERYADVLQIGARNMQNFDLLTEVGKTRKPIILKRGFSSTVKELLMSAEYILNQGNGRVILCERGIRTFEDACRNTLDLSAIPWLHRQSHLPVIVDPSHSTGHWSYVAPMSMAAVGAGADGLLIEVHSCPEKALCDGSQSLLPTKFRMLMEDVATLLDAMKRTHKEDYEASGDG